MAHPLTDEICDQIQDSIHPCDPENMRTAADLQLEQVIKWLRSTPSREYIHYWDGDAEMDKDELITDLKKAMRPSTEENN